MLNLTINSQLFVLLFLLNIDKHQNQDMEWGTLEDSRRQKVDNPVFNQDNFLIFASSDRNQKNYL